MRQRHEIFSDLVKQEFPGEFFLLEVLLDIRDLLQDQNVVFEPDLQKRPPVFE